MLKLTQFVTLSDCQKNTVFRLISSQQQQNLINLFFYHIDPPIQTLVTHKSISSSGQCPKRQELLTFPLLPPPQLQVEVWQCGQQSSSKCSSVQPLITCILHTSFSVTIRGQCPNGTCGHVIGGQSCYSFASLSSDTFTLQILVDLHASPQTID